MEFDLNSSINLLNTPKIPRSRSSANKYQEVEKFEKKFDSNRKIKQKRTISESFNKNVIESNIQVHIRVIIFFYF